MAIADQQIPFRAGVIAVLTAAGFDVVAEGSTADAILTVVEAGDSEVVIVDEDAFAVVCARAATASAATVVVVPYPTPEVVADHVSRGARAVIPRATSARQLRSIVRDVAAGEIRVPNDVLTALIEAAWGARGVLRDVDGTVVRLTRRQAQIVQLHDLGRTTIEIATTLRLSPITVRRHLCDARHAATGAGDASPSCPPLRRPSMGSQQRRH